MKKNPETALAVPCVVFLETFSNTERHQSQEQLDHVAGRGHVTSYL